MNARANGLGQGRGARGAHVMGSVRIAVPCERVFDVVADSRNEPSFNPAMTEVELLTPEPVGLGSRFRARMGRAGTVMHVELTHFERPRRLGSVTTSSIMETSGSLTFTPDGDGTVMAWDWRVRPRGWFRALGPLVGPLGRRMERGIWTGLKRRLEAEADSPDLMPGTRGWVHERRAGDAPRWLGVAAVPRGASAKEVRDNVRGRLTWQNARHGSASDLARARAHSLDDLVDRHARARAQQPQTGGAPPRAAHICACSMRSRSVPRSGSSTDAPLSLRRCHTLRRGQRARTRCE